MKPVKIYLLFAAIAAWSVLSGAQSAAQDQQVKSTFVHLGNGVPGVFYEPVNPGDKAQIAVFAMHADYDFLTFSACTELSKRGYRVLCANNSMANPAGVNMNMDRMLLDVKLGMAWLRKDPDVKKVVLLGNTGGGALMASYQNIAENGVKACQGPEKLVKCPDNLAGMPPADGMMLLNSSWGPMMMLFSIDPAVTSEDSGMNRNPALDLFDPQNGFDPKGSNYNQEFIKKFETAVGKRNTALIQSALDKLAAINAGKGLYRDDEPFDVPGANWYIGNNLLFAQDVHLMSRTEKAWPLLHADGSVTTEIVHTVRVPSNPKSTTPSFESGTLKSTVHDFLNMFAVRTTPDFSYDEDSVHGIDWTSSYTVPQGSVQGIKAPTLVMGMTGHWEVVTAETIYTNSASSDKDLAFVEGAGRMFTPCKQCEKTPGEFGDTQKLTYDYVDRWLSKPGRFK